MILVSIFGRTVALIPDETMAESDAHAQFVPCYGESFDLIFFDPQDKGLSQTILHEMIHGVLFRTAIYQGEISQDLIEMICDNVATFIVETFDLKPKKL